MTDFLVIIPIVAVFLCYLSYLKLGRFLNPIALLVSWWCFWLFLANFGLTGMFIPSGATQTRVLVMMVSLSLGAVFALEASKAVVPVMEYNDRIHSAWSRIWIPNLILLPVVGYYLVKAVRILSSFGVLGYRDAVYGTADSPSILFGNSYIELLYSLVVLPVLFLSLIVGIALYCCYGSKRVLALSLVLMSLDAIMRLGRFSFYIVGVLFLMTFLFLRQRATGGDTTAAFFRMASRKSRSAIYVLVFLIPLIVGLLSLVREGDYVKALDIMKRFTIHYHNYHTVGFVLFDNELQDPKSRLNTNLSYGRTTLGGLETIGVMFLRRMDHKARSIVQDSGTYKREQRVVGYDDFGLPLLNNAFYTIMFSLFIDGRDLMIFFGPFLFGFGLAGVYRAWLCNGDIHSLMVLNLLMYLGMFSLIFSPVEDWEFWMALALLWIVNRVAIPARPARSPA